MSRDDHASSPRGRIDFAGIHKGWSATTAVHQLDLTIEGGEFFTLLGPSGCGKTTTLMMLAGFVEPDAGDIRIDGKSITSIQPQNRNIGVVFQNYALFPHMTIAENLAFPLEMRGVGRAEIERRVKEVLDLVQLPVADRYPSQLSGGQQQRVAVARAVIFNPPVLLMDEPLGALDRKLRLHLQMELRRLQRRLGVTMVYVTHDQDEAMSMSDRIAVMNLGRIEQLGDARTLYEAPSSLFVAQFLGDNNILQGTLAGREGGLRLPDGRTLPSGSVVAAVGEAVTAAVRPERVRLTEAPGDGFLEGVVGDVIYLGAQIEYLIEVDGLGEMRAVVQNTGPGSLHETGKKIGVSWHAGDLRPFPVEAPVSA